MNQPWRLVLFFLLAATIVIMGCGKVSNITGVDSKPKTGGLSISQIIPSYNATIDHPYPYIRIQFNHELHPTRSVPYGSIEIDGQVLPIKPEMISKNVISGRISMKLMEGDHLLRINTNLKSLSGYTLKNIYRHRLVTKTKGLKFYRSFKESGFMSGAPVISKTGLLYIGSSRQNSQEPYHENRFYCLDENLDDVWSCDLGMKETIGPAVFDTAGNIYLALLKNREKKTKYYEASKSKGDIILTKISERGVILWESPVLQTEFVWNDMYVPLIINQKYTLIGGKNIFVIDNNTGKIRNLLFHNHNFINANTIQVINDRYFALGIDSSDHLLKVVAFKILSGTPEIIWTINLELYDPYHTFKRCNIVSQEDMLIVAVKDSIFKIDAMKGVIVNSQKFKSDEQIRDPQVVDNTGATYLLSHRPSTNVVLKLDLDSFTKLWEKDLTNREFVISDELLGDTRNFLILSDIQRGDYYLMDPVSAEIVGIIPMPLSNRLGIDGLICYGERLIVACPREFIDLNNNGQIDEKSVSMIYVLDKQLLDDPLRVSNILTSAR